MPDAPASLTMHRLEEWPPAMRSVAKAIGVEGALLMVEELGGLEYYIPLSIPEAHPLTELLGATRASKLAISHGGMRLAIPRDVYAHLKKGRIMSLWEQGHRQREIARAVGCTQRYVRRVVELLPPQVDPRQTRFPFAELPAANSSTCTAVGSPCPGRGPVPHS